jgi:predicted aspartyl protease
MLRSACFTLCIFVMSMHTMALNISGYGTIKSVKRFKQSALPQSAALTVAPDADGVYHITPPLNGVVPYVAIVATDKTSTTDDFYGEQRLSYIGSPLTGSAASDFTIGIFDTGASTSLFGFTKAQTIGLDTQLSESLIDLTGAGGTVTGTVTMPVGIFITGINKVNATGTTLDTSTLIGQSNVAVIVGPDEPIARDSVPTAIGIPMGVMYTTEIKQSNMITKTKEGFEYTSPEIIFYDNGDSGIPDYPISIPTIFRPRGVAAVAFIIAFTAELEFIPSAPSIIIGNSAQSLMFIHSVDLTDGTRSAIDQNEFMFDTGAQVTVISTAIASRLGLKPEDATGTVEIHDASGNSSWEPIFTIDNLTIPAFGATLSYTDVEVILLDIASPEGGQLQGIIGTNLFTEFDMLVVGAGFDISSKPTLKLKPIVVAPIIGDFTNDDKVDNGDLLFFSNAWLSNVGDPAWQEVCNLNTAGSSATKINLLDWGIFASHWLEGTP